MFRKLVKHEFIATRRLVPFVWLVTAVLAAINLIARQVDIGWLTGALLLQMSQLFFAMSVGSQARFHHLGIAGPIIFYLVLNFFLEMLTLIAMFFIPLGFELRLDPGSGLPTAGPRLVGYGMFELIRNPQDNYVIIGLGGILITAIAMAALYWGSYRLIKNRTSLR